VALRLLSQPRSPGVLALITTAGCHGLTGPPCRSTGSGPTQPNQTHHQGKKITARKMSWPRSGQSPADQAENEQRHTQTAESTPEKAEGLDLEDQQLPSAAVLKTACHCWPANRSHQLSAEEIGRCSPFNSGTRPSPHGGVGQKSRTGRAAGPAHSPDAVEHPCAASATTRAVERTDQGPAA